MGYFLCFINENDIFKNKELGFGKGFRTADHVLTIEKIMEKYLSENKKLYFCFVNFRKAYCSIWCEAIFKKVFKLWS